MPLPQEPMEIVVGLSQLDWLEKFPQLGGYLREIGASVQTYLEWNKIEKSPGVWDWSHYDRQAELLQKLGLKWVLLVAHGQAYGTPDWYKASPDRVYYRCVEHRQETEVLSHWAPNTRHHAEELIHRLGEHYPRELFSSLLLGPSGNYGETQYPCFSGTDRWTGTYHSHYGLWAADDFALADFRRYVLDKYASIDQLNREWNSHYAHIEEVKPFVLRRAPSIRAWLDQIDWYCRAIEEYTEKWIGWFKAHYPPEMLYLSIGGGGFCLAGQDFSAQAKLAAQHGVGCRITTDGTDYAWNFVNTRRLTAACRFYGARIGLEPARAIEPHGVVGRIFNAATSGAHQYHDYGYDLVKPQSTQGNPVANVPPRDPDDDPDKPGYDPRGPGYFTTLQNLGQLDRDRRPRVQVAVLNLRTYFNITQPATFGFRSGLLTGYRAPFDFESALMWLRGMIDFDFVDERMVLDGALRNYRFLIHFFGDMTERAVAAEIQRWMEEDGGLYIGTGDAIFSDVNGDYYHLDALVGLSVGVGEHYGRAPLTVQNEAILERVSQVAGQGISRTITDTSRSYFSTTQTLARGRGPAIWYKTNGRGGALFCIGTWREDEEVLKAFLVDALFNCDKLNPSIAPVNYGVENQSGLYLSVVERRDGSHPELLVLNFTPESKRYQRGDIVLEIAPFSIIRKPLP